MSDLGEPQSPVQIGAAYGENLVRDRAFSYNNISYLDHAPATSHGTYLAGRQDGIENLEDYQAGGYHLSILAIAWAYRSLSRYSQTGSR